MVEQAILAEEMKSTPKAAFVNKPYTQEERVKRDEEELEELMNVYQKTIKKQKEDKCIEVQEEKNVDDLDVSVKSNKYQIKILSNRTTTVSFD